MFEGHSWGEFSLFLFCAGIIYYGLVLAFYYREEVLAWLPNQKAAVSPAAAPPTSAAFQSPVKRASAVPAIAPAAPVEPPVKKPTPAVKTTAPVAAQTALAAPAPVESDLIGVEQLVGFLDRVQAGDFDPEAEAEQVPAALENTVLLAEVFARSLSKRRALLAEVEE